MAEVRLPRSDGRLKTYRPSSSPSFSVGERPPQSRTAFAAAHVVCDPLADTDPIAAPAVDWEATLAYRRHLWSLGLAVAEAMDTAQRGMGLGWDDAKELIARSAAEARSVGGRIASGAGTDHMPATSTAGLDEVVAAYEEQVAYVEAQGSPVILMASRALAAAAEGPDDYAHVYDRILSQVKDPVIIHWLGPMFDPALKGYWGHDDLHRAMDVCLAIVTDHAGKVDGVKMSLLDKEMEIAMRRRLPDDVRMYTGDDFNYPELIKGDAQGYSHALLGIFDAIAPAAAAALQALDQDQGDRYEEILAPTVPLSRHIFQEPTFYYKTGIVFMAYLNGHQDHFRMVAGMESARSVVHLSQLFVLADEAGLLEDGEEAARRMGRFLALAGID